MTEARSRTAHAVAAVATTVAFAVLAAIAHPVRAQTEIPPEAVADVARELNCPVCQGYTLQDCPLLVCSQMRDVIRDRLAEGESKEEIIEGFVAEYGPQVMNEPPREGFFLAAWVLPVVALAAGAVVAVLVLRPGHQMAPAAVETGAATTADPEYVVRLERMAAGDGGPGSAPSPGPEEDVDTGT